MIRMHRIPDASGGRRGARSSRRVHVDDDVRNPAVADMEQIGSPRGDVGKVQAARSAAPGESNGHDHPFLVNLSVLHYHVAEVFPGIQGLAEALCHTVQPFPDVRCRPVGDDELDLGVRPSRRAVVTALPIGEDRAHKVQVLRHRLPPFLGEAFGGSTGLVDVGGRKASDRASHTEVDPSLALSNTTGATNQTPVLNHHSKHNPTAEMTDLLKLEVQFLVGPEPVLKEAAYRGSTLEELGPPVQDPIFGDAAHHPVGVTSIQSLNLLAKRRGRGQLHETPRERICAAPCAIVANGPAVFGVSCRSWFGARVSLFGSRRVVLAPRTSSFSTVRRRLREAGAEVRVLGGMVATRDEVRVDPVPPIVPRAISWAAEFVLGAWGVAELDELRAP